MRVLSHDLRHGELRLVDAPTPDPAPGRIVVRTLASLVSSGTERMLVDFGRGNLLEKALAQPERVRKVVDKARADGVRETVDAVRGQLGTPITLGYANAGLVVGIGADVRDLRVGDLVASTGPHAEIVSVPSTLAAVVPAGLAPTEACAASVAAVGLEAIRLARCEIGERFAVTGLGLVGLLTTQLLVAQGCEVLGIDPDPARRALAESFGATAADPDTAAAAAADLSRGRGLDGVLICASTRSSAPVQQAAALCRERGRIVLVGVTGLELDRTAMYEKELSFQVSRAYGPGRYDPVYESGQDYPFGLVRWTAARNMEAVLSMMAAGRVGIGPMITHRFPFDEATRAYDSLQDDPSALAIVLDYPETVPAPAPAPSPARRAPRAAPTGRASGRVAVIGAGNFATRTLIPAIRSAGEHVDVIASRSGIDAGLAAATFDATAMADVDAVIGDPGIDVVFIATRHDSHAQLAARCVDAGKATFVEKPLAITPEQLDAVEAALDRVVARGEDAPVLTVGFNRRFAPASVRMRTLLAGLAAPKVVTIEVNAGSLPADHWTQDRTIGGGRILGEGCHFVDLARFLVGAPIRTTSTTFLGHQPALDSALISIGFEDGSTAAIQYYANGSPRAPKERIEVACDGRSLVNENFRSLTAHGFRARRRVRYGRPDKGHRALVAAFLRAARLGGPAPIPFDELVEVSRASIDVASP